MASTKLRVGFLSLLIAWGTGWLWSDEGIGGVTLHVALDYELLRTATVTLDDWDSHPHLWCLTVQSDSVLTRAYIHFQLSSTRYGEISRGNTEFFAVEGNTVKCNTDFTTLYGEETNPTFEDELRRIQRLPADTYTLHFELWDGGTNPSANRYREPRGRRLTARTESVPIVHPSAPRLIRPADGSTTGLFPVFQWQRSEVRGPLTGEKPLRISYTLRVHRMFDGQGQPLSEEEAVAFPPIFEVTVINGSSVLFDPGEATESLQPGRTYAWQVKAVDEVNRPVGNNEGRSRIFRFTPQFTPPRLSAPSGMPPTFVWSEAQASGMSVSYALTLSADPAYAEGYVRRGLMGTSLVYDGPPLMPGTVYYWKVQTTDGAGKPLGEAAEDQFVASSLRLIEPVGKSSSLSPTFVWEPYWGVEEYQIQVWTPRGDLLWTSVVYDTHVAYGGDGPLEYDTSYRWTVEAVVGGQPVGEGTEATFTTPSSAAPQVALRSPLDVVVEDLTPRFVWEPVEGAEQYTLRLFDETGKEIYAVEVEATAYVLSTPTVLAGGRAYRWTVEPTLGRTSEMGTFYTPSLSFEERGMTFEEADRVLRTLLPDITDLQGFSLVGARIDGVPASPDDLVRLLRRSRILSVSIE